MYKYLLLFCLFVGFCSTAFAQKPDTTVKVIRAKADTITSTRKDTIAGKTPKPKKEKLYFPDSTHSPHKAIMHSLMIPGWGQVYNRQIWKVPLIYAALGTSVYFLIFNSKNAHEYLILSQYREHGVQPKQGDPFYAEYNAISFASDQAVYDVYNYYLRDKDLSIFAIIGFWGINVIDSYVAAKFINAYTVDNNLSMRIAPTLLNQNSVFAFNNSSSYIPGIKITFTLK
jgi:hypothetical protein